MIEIIPAIDLIDGKCVRLAQGDFARKIVYPDDPVEVAVRFYDAGIRRLHIVDLDGARSGTPKNLATLECVSAATDLIIDYGGGIRTIDNARAAIAAGASIVNIGSIAVTSPDVFSEMIETFGADRFLLGADVKDQNISINGWQTDTDVSVFAFLRKYAELGVKDVFVTDVGMDGMMAGPSISLYRQITSALQEVRLIASGGVRSMADIEELNAIGCRGVIVGKAFYEGGITLDEVSDYVGKANHSLP